MFEAEEDTNDPDSPYLRIQRQFETSPELSIGSPAERQSCQRRMAVSDFEEASQVIKIISGEVDLQ